MGHVVPGLRPAQANWWCPAKKDTTRVANCSLVGEWRLKPPRSAVDCCVVGELRLRPPQTHTHTHTHTHAAVCYVSCALPLTVLLECVWRVLRVLCVLGVASSAASEV